MTAPASDDLVAFSREVIQSGSTSFATAAKLFEPRTRASAYLLYAWCRHCDDVVDGQTLGHDAVPLTSAERLARVEALYAQTRAALAGEAVEAPVFRAFQAVAKAHGLPPDFAFDHLAGFRWDAEGVRVRTFENLLRYCYHVAGAVGLMMAWIMGVRDEGTLDRACDLGIAFQLTNIARDVVEDAEAGRVYVPETWLAEAGLSPADVPGSEHRPALYGLARRLVAEAEPYYRSAQWGVARLPLRCAWAVGAARSVYREIGRKLERAGMDAWASRVSTSRSEKLVQVARGFASANVAALTRRGSGPARDGLWTRPERGSDGLQVAAHRPIDGQQPF